MIFEVDGKQYGDEIDLNITIKEKQKKIDDDNHENEIQKFRKTFGLNSMDYPDEKLLVLLKKYNFDFPKVFAALFDD